jgi:GT2 family glycosyltransferase
LKHDPDLTAILVNHRTAHEVASAVASIRRAFAEESIRGEVVVVDCASGADENAALRAIDADRLLLLDDNRGYSGGLNAGLAAAGSKALLLANADVELVAGSLAPLLERANDRAVGAVAPLQFADREQRVILPTGFGAGFRRDWLQSRGGSGTAGDARRFSRFAARQWKLWTHGGETDCLTGSLLLTRRDVLDRAGRFDERYLHEYEETEWEGRVRAAGFSLRVEASARALHFHATSASRNPDTARRRAASRALYRRRHYGRLGELILRMSEGRKPALKLRKLEGDLIAARGPEFALAVSPNPSVLPFAAVRLDSPAAAGDLFSSVGPSLHARVFQTATGACEEAFWMGRP